MSPSIFEKDQKVTLSLELDDSTNIKEVEMVSEVAETSDWILYVEKNLKAVFLSHPVIPYHFTLSTAIEQDASTTARVYVIIIGPNDVETDRLWLDLPEGKKSFTAGSMEHFVCYGTDVGEIKRVEVRIWDSFCS